MSRRKKQWISIFLAAVLLFTAAGSIFIYYLSEDTKKIVVPEVKNSINSTAVIARLDHTLPSAERSFYVRPGVDICVGNATEDTVREELSALFTDMLDLGCSSLYLDSLFHDGTAAYTTTIRKAGKIDLFELVIQQAEENNISVYAVYHIFGGGIPKSFSLNNLENIDKDIASFASYYPSGIVLTDYYTEKSSENYYAYIESGSGETFEAWLTQKTEGLVKQAADSFVYANNAVPVGLLCDPVWENAPSNPLGSGTKSSSTALSKYADTRRMLELGRVDFAVVNIFTAIEDETEPFNEILSWWNKLCTEIEMPLTVVVATDKIAAEEGGWKEYDQIVRQATGVMNLDATGERIVFFGYKRLLENPFGIKDLLTSYFGERYGKNGLFKDLTVTSPKRPNIVTTDDKITFEGISKQSSDVEINGKKVLMSPDGEFAAQFPLEMGKNLFVLSNKENSQLYSITRKLQILKEVSPNDTTRLNGGIALTVSALAYDGADVTATLGGTTIKLNKSQGSNQKVENTSAYVSYTGIFYMPSSTDKEQDFGVIKFRANLGERTEGQNGGRVIVNSQRTVDTPVPEGGSFPQVRVKSKYADVFSPQNTCTYPSAYYYQLPQGTIDYVDTEHTHDGEKYYVLHSGKRIKAGEADFSNGSGHGLNSITSATAEATGGATYLRFNNTWNAPFNILFPDEKYGVGNDYGDNGDTNYSVGRFRGNRIALEFDYAVEHPNLTLPSGGIFSAATWSKTERNNIPRLVLTLTLKKPGKYFGAYAYYEGNVLVFKFYNPPTSMNGVRVYIDAGHGMPNDPGIIGYGPNPGQFIRESDLNKAICDSLSSKLKAMGATVSYNSSWRSTEDRISSSINFEPHVFVSVHCNGGVSSASGAEMYYNTPFSHTLGSKLLDKMGEFYNSTLYPGGGTRTRGVRHSAFGVTRQKQFSSVLAEVGFISNWDEANKLKNNPIGISEALAQGIKAYVLE